jgi:DNA primase
MTSSGIVADIKSRLPVVEIVGETVALKRAGSAYKGLCPFHAEKTPSFIVTPDRESWHCFGCGKGGDIFTFLMEREGLEFREALERLAERAGVELSERTAREDRRKKRLREALEAAITWYREVLIRTPQGERGRAYLAGRGFSDETLERFAIGYAPNAWDALSKRLQARGFTDEELTGAGLASGSNRGGVIDKFRGRVIIPIRDASGRAIGLGGRILPGVEGPKYLNSPATLLFDKSRALFAIDLAKAAIRREKVAVIVEGYTDVMAAHQAGFENVVASLGTALTSGQIELALKYADEIALAYDVDLAGDSAARGGLLSQLGPNHSVSKVRLVRIPAGKDPDELIKTDPNAWRAAVARARDVVSFEIDRLAADHELGSVPGKRAFTGRVLALIRGVPDRLEQGFYLQMLARLVSVDERTLAEALAHAPAGRRAPRSADAASSDGARPVLSLGALESEALELMLRFPMLASELPADEPMPFREAVATQLAEALRARARARTADGAPAVVIDESAALDGFIGGLDAATGDLARELLAAAVAGRNEPALDPIEAREVLRSCLLRLRGDRIEEALRDGRLLLEEAQRDGDTTRLAEIEQRLNILGREKAETGKAISTPAGLAGTRR